MPLGDIAQIGGEKVEVAFDLLADFRTIERLHPGCSQLDAQGHTAHQPADGSDNGFICLFQGKTGLRLPGSLEEQLHGAIRFDSRRRILRG